MLTIVSNAAKDSENQDQDAAHVWYSLARTLLNSILAALNFFVWQFLQLEESFELKCPVGRWNALGKRLDADQEYLFQ